MTTSEYRVCLTPECGLPGEDARGGLCKECHAEALRLVDHGPASFRQLDELGLYRPSDGRSLFQRAYDQKVKEYYEARGVQT